VKEGAQKYSLRFYELHEYEIQGFENHGGYSCGTILKIQRLSLTLFHSLRTYPYLPKRINFKEENPAANEKFL
jgi:hypothetical protein